MRHNTTIQRRIWDFPDGGRQPKVGRQPIIRPNFSENRMKMKEIGPVCGGAPKMLLSRSVTAIIFIITKSRGVLVFLIFCKILVSARFSGVCAW